MKKSLRSYVFDGIIMLIILIAIACTVIPFFNVIALSLSEPDAIMSGSVSLVPVGFNLEAYSAVFRDSSMIRSLFFTIGTTLLYVMISMFMTVCAAYPLTRKRLWGRSVISFLMIFTMYFSGGIIPEYILYKSLKITNSIWVLVLPGAISAYNMVILKSFFESIPESLEESARLDGAGDIRTLIQIILPLSLPILATLCLFYAVSRWNVFQDALYYITNAKLYPLQMKLYMLLNIAQSSELSQFEGANISKLVPENIKSASIMFATVPILIVYPWLQRYFVTGVTLGAVKE